MNVQAGPMTTGSRDHRNVLGKPEADHSSTNDMPASISLQEVK